MNLARSPQDDAKHELEFVNLQLMHVIQHAKRWHDIRKAADAMFHARLIWKSAYSELFAMASDGGSAGSEVINAAPEEASA